MYYFLICNKNYFCFYFFGYEFEIFGYFFFCYFVWVDSNCL